MNQRDPILKTQNCIVEKNSGSLHDTVVAFVTACLVRDKQTATILADIDHPFHAMFDP